MARLASHVIVLRLKRKAVIFNTGNDTVIETTEHLAVTSQRKILVRATVVTRTQGEYGTGLGFTVKREYGKWLHSGRVRVRVDLREFHSRLTLQGWITVKESVS